ncbi:MAG: hypothetical protein IT438_09235 [Phycisphaerales bacterium]|nr:hypothetical protein [Phycisphaerales bacterium]
MKRLWMMISTLAIANVLAIGGLLGWLHFTDRLSRDRFESVRQMLKVTLTQEAKDKADDAAAAEAAKVKADADAKAAAPPETAADRIVERQLQSEKELQQVRRKQQELENLKGFVLRQIADLEQREAQLQKQRAAFEAERKRIAETEATEQFKSALATLESQRPRDARLMLAALMTSNQTDQVVSYLARMDEGKRGKVIAEFVKDQPAVAADLLERIRTRGQVASVPPIQGGGGQPAAAAR